MIKKIIPILCIILAISLVCTDSYFKATEEAIASGVIRFHVIANSDSDADQALKLKVRDRIISAMGNLFDENGNTSAAREVITANLDAICAVAEDEIKKNGYTYPVKVSLGKSDFPTKDYGSIILPAGSYEALKIEIGEAGGKNWWCVLFPPLCFVNESCVTADSTATQKIEESVGKSNASLISKDKNQSAQIKFKTYEIWQKGKQKLAVLFK